MSEPDTFDNLLRRLKALSDETRLRVVVLLLERPRTGEELAFALGLRAPTISHHLKRLSEAGLIDVRPDQFCRVYSLRPGALREAAAGLDARRLAERARPAADGFAEKVLQDFIEHGRLKTIPRQRKKREIVLQHLAERFASGETYDEAEVNETLSAFHEDVATLRREMIGYGLLSRQAGQYRRAP